MISAEAEAVKEGVGETPVYKGLATSPSILVLLGL